jgi:DNA-binding transcriptional ArsR family regulator
VTAVPDAGTGPLPPAGPDGVLTALADLTRRQLLAALAEQGPRTASELASRLPISRQAVAKHPAVLSQAGLVVSAKHGRDVRFSVRTGGLVRTAGWMAQLAAEWDARLAVIKRIAETSDP